jgi:hypothetical protein
MIVSLNGALISPNPCISLLLQPGVNYLSLGIK